MDLRAAIAETRDMARVKRLLPVGVRDANGRNRPRRIRFFIIAAWNCRKLLKLPGMYAGSPEYQHRLYRRCLKPGI